jgi:hypothetical protein
LEDTITNKLSAGIFLVYPSTMSLMVESRMSD